MRKFVCLLSLLLLVFSAPRAQADRLFTDGAEQGAAALTTQWTAQTIGPTFVTTAPHSGTYHYRFLSAANTIFIYRSLASSVTSGTYYTRFYVRFATAPNAITTLFSVVSSGGNASARVLYDNANAQFQAKNDISGNVAQGTVTITTGVWYRVEFKIVVGDSGGSIEMKYFSGDSTVALETLTPTGTDTMVVNNQRFQIGLFGVNNTGNVYFDDIAINDATGAFQNTYPGPGKIFTLKANGDNAVAWTKAGSSPQATNWQGVDETPTVAPNDGTDYNADSGSTNVDRLTLSNLGAEVPANATIVLADVYARAGCGAAGSCSTNNSKLLLRLWDEGGSSTDGPTISPSNTANTWTILSTAEHLVFNATGKTKANFDSFNAGYVGTGVGADEKWVTAVWVNVEWNASTYTPRHRTVVY